MHNIVNDAVGRQAVYQAVITVPTEGCEIQSNGRKFGKRTLTTASVAVELWAKVCMTSSGGNKLRLSICNDDVKAITL